MVIPTRQTRLAGRHALVDGIPFTMPVHSEQTPALMAAFSIDPDAARSLIPGNEVHPFRLWKRALLVVSVVDYRITNIGKYIEYSIAIACTHGSRRAPRLLPALMMRTFGTGQYVWDLPVSTEISVKGGKGIWGMPKHQASLDFVIGDDWVSSQYDMEGQMLMRIDVRKPASAWLPLNMGAANYCAFRGMLMKSRINFRGKLGFSLFSKGASRLFISDHPRMAPLKTLDIDPEPIFAGFFPSTRGVLDDYFECWFVSEAQPPLKPMDGLESTFFLGQSRQWLPDPQRAPDWEKGR
ncbi:acetoacetate decarboxylase family protein [Paraburkholderia elongata]|uniref:Acetoacetate decarboxylase n=1 Tax=Paraburkholderia elongata TaxID=2675747 RepID=A0A972NUS2_9BURK|nr:acetoacetate decarboxylase family protein [Paraburkholderia elongata]NPT58187.1 acetoacetate decarboxylase [Paraburkholderia elongata]NPT62125.1 acetoacetate decarboxylase [Paraburkholderia elongata]